MEQATTNGVPVIEQRVLASSLPLLPLSGRTARMTVRTWGDLGGAEVEQRCSHLDFQLLGWSGCRSPMEGWVGDQVAYQVDDTSGSVQLVQIVDAADGLDANQSPRSRPRWATLP